MGKDKEEKEKSLKEEESERDEEFDIAKATEIARNWLRDNIVGGNLNLVQYRLQHVRKNNAQTKYIVIMSIVPDVGQKRIFYWVKVDILKETIVDSVLVGNREEDGKIVFEEFKGVDIDEKALE